MSEAGIGMNPAYNPYLAERRYRQASLLRACSWVLHCFYCRRGRINTGVSGLILALVLFALFVPLTGIRQKNSLQE
jgi:hypothetical protein